MRKTYTLHVAGLERELPLCPVNEKMDIAAFIMFSDVELTIACAKALLEKLPEFDVIVTAEAKGMQGKRVVIADDVISTGGSLHALEALVSKCDCTVVARAAVLAEGDAADRGDITFLAPLPLFFHD